MSEILIKLLEEKLKNWNIHSTIGDVFSRVVSLIIFKVLKKAFSFNKGRIFKNVHCIC